MALKTNFALGEKSVTLIASFTWLADFRLRAMVDRPVLALHGPQPDHHRWER